MERGQYHTKKYTVQAKRKDAKEKWTEWNTVDSYEEAEKQARRAEEVGYCTRIIYKGEDQNE